MQINCSIASKALLWGCAVFAGLQLTAYGQPTLINRWSFNEASGTNATDSVSGAIAVLMNGASLSGGQANIGNGTGETSADYTNGQYIVLPSTICSNYSAMTIETWITPGLDVISGNQWGRIWDFGNTANLNQSNMGGSGAWMFARIGAASGGISPEADSFLAGNGDNWNYASATFTYGLENHLVWTADGNTHIAKLYLNGNLISTTYTFTNSPAVIGVMTNNWLGRSKFAGDPLINANFNEFRIYDGAISALQVAADQQTGPDTYPASYGTVTSLAMQLTSTNIPVGTRRIGHLMASASALSSPVDIHDNPNVIWTSSDTNVAAVDVHGGITGMAAGTADIVATYNALSVTQSVTVYVQPPTLLHRYSFNETSGGTAHDSVGTADGTLYGNAAFDGSGQVVLDGTAGSWVDLPAHLLDSSKVTANAVTIMAWGTFAPTTGSWSYLFNFGDISENGSGNFGIDYLMCSVNGGGGITRTESAKGSPGYQNTDGAQIGQNVLGRTNIQIVVVYNPNPLRKVLDLYTNGVLAASTTTTHDYTDINDVYTFIGRSLYSADSWLNGSIDEFRIYNGELNKFQVGASYQAGPSSTTFDVGTPTNMVLNPGVVPIAYGAPRQVQALLEFTKAGSVAVNGDSGLTFSSSDPSVATIDNTGTLTSLKPGTTTITGIYTYVAGVTTRFTNSVSVTFVRDYSPPILMHRYSFNTDGTADDSVGGPAWTGTLVGNASVTNGELILPNTTTSSQAGDYLQLPSGILTNADNGIGTNYTVPATTIEAWVSLAPAQQTWANLFDFGTQDANGFDAYSISFCVNTGGSPANNNNAAISDGDNANVDRYNAFSAPSLAGSTNVHLVVVFDPEANYTAYYTNGVLMGINGNVTLTNGMAGINATRNIIGADNWPDPGLLGSVDEFRVWNGVLHPDEIAADYAAGPNALPSTAPTLSTTVSGGSLVVSWPTNNASGFFLESSPSVGSSASWSTNSAVTTSGANYQATVPITGSAQFFRLIK